jgi:hypothetical protein
VAAWSRLVARWSRFPSSWPSLAAALVEAKIAETKSYRDFMIEVNRLVPRSEKLILAGGFNGDAVAFYRGGMVEVAERPADNGSAQISEGRDYVITTEKN